MGGSGGPDALPEFICTFTCFLAPDNWALAWARPRSWAQPWGCWGIGFDWAAPGPGPVACPAYATHCQLHVYI